MLQKNVAPPFQDRLPGAMIHAPSTRRPAAKVPAPNNLEKSFHEGVDGEEKRCRMGGSPRTKRLGAQTGNGMQANDL